MRETPGSETVELDRTWHLAEGLIGAALRGDDAAWPADAPITLTAAIMDAADYHGTDVLLHERVQPEWNWPANLRTTLRQQSLDRTMHELRNGAVVSQLIDALSSAGIPNLLLKGTGLAYTSYANSVCRVRADTDLLIREQDIARARGCLLALGYTCDDPNLGKRYIYQLSFVLTAQDHSKHCVDLHWQVSNSSFLSQRFSFDELYRNAKPAPRLHPAALAHGTIDALLITSMHRASHRYIGGRLIWLYDVHLLAGEMTEPDWTDLVARAHRKSLCTPTLESFELAGRYLSTQVPREALAALAAGTGGERVPAYFASGRMSRRRMDIAALGGAGHRVAYIAEMLWPPPAYLLSKYPDARIKSLPVLHARRLAAGIGMALGSAWRRSTGISGSKA
jgi:hypothetical protein